jgi:hypothetical protein
MKNEVRGEKLIAAQHVKQMCEMLLTFITGYPVTRVDTRIVFFAHLLFRIVIIFFFKWENISYLQVGGTAVAQWLRFCATNRKVAGSIPADVIGFFR